MDLRFTAEERAFRDEVRGFIDANLPAETRARMEEGRVPSKAQSVAWHATLHARGWSVPDWPVEHGGTGWSAVQRYIFREELQQAPAPQPSAFGTLMVGPVLIAFGTEAQRARFLPGIRSGETWWCQGFSEPGAGSDLASLKTRAVRDGDHYVIDGQKTWTTLAQHADWIFLLARTDPQAPKPQEGISFLLADMRSPGITVRPIITIDGAHEVNEVFFDSVRIPADQLVGVEHRGWDCAKFLLGNERSGQARVGVSKERLRALKRIAAAAPGPEGRKLLEDARFRERIAAVEVELKALEMTTLRVLAAEAGRRNGRAPDPASSILKVKGSEILQAISELYLEAAGPYALPAAEPDAAGWNEPEIAPGWAAMAGPTYLNWRKLSIYGGTNEIQRNIMAKAFLGL
jgi:alkylation response protein AidB-like acyl-CoA dehydrogenase